MFLCYDLYRHITAKSFPSDSHFHRCHVPCVVPGNEGKTLMTPGRLLPLPPTPLGESREKKIIQKPYAEWKSSSSGPNCHWFVWHGHISGLDFCLWHKLSFSSRDEDSLFYLMFLPVKCKNQSNLQVSRQRDPGCSLYRLLCNYWCYSDLVMLVKGTTFILSPGSLRTLSSAPTLHQHLQSQYLSCSDITKKTQSETPPSTQKITYPQGSYEALDVTGITSCLKLTAYAYNTHCTDTRNLPHSLLILQVTDNLDAVWETNFEHFST